ncbi:PAS domain S-box-containing protein/diguanylate cyclase (GGDEF) domain-containing protein [Cohnella sp. OV330]|uniref:bifunctional diguanylate cyclase/phosphodiesterase n=1 Tax=Cohnella sp. OV330 TaxID=1855288 RepID=UPI0008EFC333|nr:bifunctional diguanylate cyclase/phosphodiesterase [Cohnella sp. OV330]SFB17047.1 PAS domain S-box-containing protein/diguanylate cyclase (GGDEF) domain-containing protein [Cohnella sp. OV330]
MTHTHGSYDLSLVLLSYLIAVLASYTTLDLAGRIGKASSGYRTLWIGFSAAIMGMGIWSMHFVGMLALRLPMTVKYDGALVFISAAAAIAGCFVALNLAAKPNLGYRRLLLAGVFLASGICAMHYIGMDAMKMQIDYSPLIVTLSVVIALLASIAALWLAFVYHRQQKRYAIRKKLASGLIMGAAVAGMHYTGMSAAAFEMDHAMMHGNMDMFSNQRMMAYGVVVGTLLTLGLSLGGIVIAKRFAAKQLRIEESQNWYKAIYDSMTDGIITLSLDRKITGLNPSAERIVGVDQSALIGMPLEELLRVAVSERTDELENILALVKDGKRQQYESTVVNAKGERLSLEVSIATVRSGDGAVGMYMKLRDITEDKSKEEHIRKMAYEDDLTGLPNRRMWQERLAETASELGRIRSCFAVMVLDIDRFKLINDSLGHQYGDQFLKDVSERIALALEGSGAELARLGGDEFAILVMDACSREELSSLAEEIVHQIQRPYPLQHQDYYVTASIGIAVCPEHGEQPDQLLRHADLAMYEIKKQGKNGYRFYQPELNDKLTEKLELERDFRQALPHNELELYYQPQVRSSDGVMIGVEALVRWNHPRKGMISPGVFIPLAEEIALVGPLGDWVLREACRQMREWHLAGGPLVPVSVNLSSQQFYQSNLDEHIANILSESGLEPHFLDLEITESMMMDVEVSTAILNRLSALGVRISLDDFGTGYSSLSYLKHFPIHKLKIDRSFIRDITVSESDRAIVATIISMAEHLKLDIIAEGIETKEQLDILRDQSCREIQGYYFSKPIPAGEIERSFFEPLREGKLRA